MEKGFSLKSVITNVLENLASSIADLAPRLLTAIIVILIGILIAKIIERLVRTTFEKLKINDLLQKVGLVDVLERLGLRRPPGYLVARTIYVLLVVLFVQSATQAVGLVMIAGAIGSFFAYLPNIVSAALVLLLGTMVAQFADRAVTQAAGDSGVEYAKTLGRIVSSLIFFVVIIMSISQLKFDIEIVRSVVLVLLSGIAIALALSFGLGSRDVTRNIVAGFYARKIFHVGEEVEIGTEKGVLAGITSVQTLIEREGRTVAIPNRVFLERVVKQ